MSDIPERLTAAFADRYAIERELGAGGMATVYLATDLKHERRVAIKVLHPELAAVIGGERFVAEIKTTAALQHPHILPLFDSGEADGFLYYVMPFIDGETLRERLDRAKQLPVEEAVRIAKGVGAALQYAHERDIVHRDIKPANILMHAGEPVVADFGIAIAISAAGGGRLTETGMSVGTPHYMSPEQASADRDVDARSDTYALACVTYEMLAGEPPHTGTSAQAVLMRILTENPRDVTDLRRAVPEHIRDALAKGLEKLPADRFASAHDFTAALEDASFRYEPTATLGTRETRAVAAPGTGGPARILTWGLPAFALAAGLALGSLLAGGGGTDPAGGLATRAVVTHDGLTFEAPGIMHLSPDGSLIGFVGDEGILDGIFVRRADELRFRHVPGSEEAADMAFSPDGASIAMATNQGGIQLLPTAGGATRDLVSLVPGGIGAFGLGWEGDQIVFGSPVGGTFEIFRVSAAGGTPDRMLASESGVALPIALIDGGSRLLYLSVTDQAIMSFDPGGGEPTRVVEPATWAWVLDTGDLVYVDAEGGVWVAPFDEGTGEITCDPRTLFSGVDVSQGAVAMMDLASNGTMVYRTGAGNAATALDRLTVVDFDGSVEEIPITPRRFRNVRWSPDGNVVAFAALEPGQQSGRTSIYTYDVGLRTATRQLTSEGTQAFPIWSPDGTRLAYVDAQSPFGPDGGLGAILEGDIATVSADGSDAAILAPHEGQDVPYQWVEGVGILFTGGPDTGSSDYLLADAETGEVSPYLDIDGDLGSVSVSPDGRWAAFLSSEAPGEAERIVVRAFPAAGPPVPVSEGPGDRPRWNRAGDRLYYWLSDFGLDSLVAATVRTAPAFEVIDREVLLVGEYPIGTWDLHPDGDRIVIAAPALAETESGESAPDPEYVLVTNWFAELRAALADTN